MCLQPYAKADRLKPPSYYRQAEVKIDLGGTRM
jgi:hypothetical protein